MYESITYKRIDYPSDFEGALVEICDSVAISVEIPVRCTDST